MNNPDKQPVGYSLTRRGEDAKGRPEDLPCIDRLPSSTFDMVKMAIRFKVIHRDRPIRLLTEGLGTKPFHGRIVMLVNEHTLSAGEMVPVCEAGQRRVVEGKGVRVSNSLSGGDRQLDEAPAVRDPAQIVQIGRDYRMLAGKGQRRVSLQ